MTVETYLKNVFDIGCLGADKKQEKKLPAELKVLIVIGYHSLFKRHLLLL